MAPVKATVLMPRTLAVFTALKTLPEFPLVDTPSTTSFLPPRANTSCAKMFSGATSLAKAVDTAVREVSGTAEISGTAGIIVNGGSVEVSGGEVTGGEVDGTSKDYLHCGRWYCGDSDELHEKPQCDRSLIPINIEGYKFPSKILYLLLKKLIGIILTISNFPL